MGSSKSFQFQYGVLVKVTLWTLSLLGGIAFLNYLIILHLIGHEVNLKKLPFKMERNPAAFAKTEGLQNKIYTPVIKYNCKNKTAKKNAKEKATTTRTPTARIELINCPKVIHLENKTNKNQGVVFPVKKDIATSDFISLEGGINEVVIQFAKSSLQIDIFREVEEADEGAKTF